MKTKSITRDRIVRAIIYVGIVLVLAGAYYAHIVNH
jgi:hypothetical protein